MRLKRFVCLLLSIIMVLYTFADCLGESSISAEAPDNSTPAQVKNPTPEPQISQPDDEVFQFSDDEELLLAYEMGFVPEAIWEELTADVSLADFCAMLKSIIAGVNAGQVHYLILYNAVCDCITFVK